MEIDLGNECVVELQAAFTQSQIRDRALIRRVEAFGQVARFIQRAKPEDIDISVVQKRYKVFWLAVGTSRYVYDRRHTYQVEVAPEVQQVTIYDNKHDVVRDRTGVFELEAVEHCVEESRAELTLDPMRGQETDYRKYLTFPRTDVADLAALEAAGSEVEAPEIRSSFVVRKIISQLMKTFQADNILEEKIFIEEVTLCCRPVYAVEYNWKSKNKKMVEEFDALTGEINSEGGQIRQGVRRVLKNDALFDIGADTIGMVMPGANIAIKLGRFAASKAVR
ncbi:MAG: hypothetical protein Q7O66_22400 [Dehalococcoidia bacterium]|nr:hypothetical protein [Dehalococcoidia bacterium]